MDDDDEIKKLLGTYYAAQEETPAPDVRPAVRAHVSNVPMWRRPFAGVARGLAWGAAAIVAVIIGLNLTAPAGQSATTPPVTPAITTPTATASPTATPTPATNFNGSTMTLAGGPPGDVALTYINCNVKASLQYENVVVGGTVGTQWFYAQIIRSATAPKPGDQPSIVVYTLTPDGQSTSAAWAAYQISGITYGTDSITIDESVPAMAADMDNGPGAAEGTTIAMHAFLSCPKAPANPAAATSLSVSGPLSGSLVIKSVSCGFPQADVVNATLAGTPVTIRADSPQGNGPSSGLGSSMTVTSGSATWTALTASGMVFGNGIDSFNVDVPATAGAGQALHVTGTIGCAN